MFFSLTVIYPLTAGIVGAPQITSKPVSSIFLCSPLPSGTWRTPSLSIPWCCLSTFFSVCLVFFPFSLLLRPDLMNGRHVHTTSVYVSLRWSGGLRVVRLPARSALIRAYVPVWLAGLKTPAVVGENFVRVSGTHRAPNFTHHKLM